MDKINILENFQGKSVLVLGDFILDKYVWGNVTRVSKEAPIPVIKKQKLSYVLGGAGNVAATISELNGNVKVIGLLGEDPEAEHLKELLHEHSIITDDMVEDSSRPTTKKTRVVVGGNQVARIDTESDEPASGKINEKIKQKLLDILPEVDVIVISDRGKGIVTRELMYCITKECKAADKKIIIDPFPAHKDYYSNSYIITPIPAEVREMFNISLEEGGSMKYLGEKTREYFRSNIIIEHSKEGLLVAPDAEESYEIPRHAHNIADITGSRDAFIGVLAMAVATGADLRTAAELSNAAYDITCQKLGTATVTIGELRKLIERKELVF